MLATPRIIYGGFGAEIKTSAKFDMPDQLINLLINFLQQNKGKLSKRARQREFKALTDEESEEIEVLFSEIFKSS